MKFNFIKFFKNNFLNLKLDKTLIPEKLLIFQDESSIKQWKKIFKNFRKKKKVFQKNEINFLSVNGKNTIQKIKISNNTKLTFSSLESIKKSGKFIKKKKNWNKELPMTYWRKKFDSLSPISIETEISGHNFRKINKNFSNEINEKIKKCIMKIGIRNYSNNPLELLKKKRLYGEIKKEKYDSIKNVKLSLYRKEKWINLFENKKTKEKIILIMLKNVVSDLNKIFLFNTKSKLRAPKF
jgi:hypothetical protein